MDYPPHEPSADWRDRITQQSTWDYLLTLSTRTHSSTPTHNGKIGRAHV